MPASLRLFCVLTFALTAVAPSAGGDWPAFRGPAGTGVAAEERALPSELGPESPSLVWKTDIPKGHSTPIVSSGRIFLTAFDKPRLVTMALDVETGRVLWQRESTYSKLEGFHRVGNPATPSVATDGEHVFSFFGSSGLACYDFEGERQWFAPMGPFQDSNGATGSPLLVGERIVMIQDHDANSYLAAYDKQTGRQLWKTLRPNAKRNYCSPVVWNTPGGNQIVIAGSAMVVGYDLETGQEIWTVRGISRVVDSTPVAGPSGLLYVSATGGGDASGQPAFEEVIETADANGNSTLEKDELPKSLIRNYFSQFDRNVDGKLDRDEYESIRGIFNMSRSVAMAIRPGGRGDITDSHVLWTHTTGIPRNPSPLLYEGRLYLIRDGGVVTCLDASSGEQLKQARLPGRGKYFSSAVAGDGKVYCLSDRGELSVFSGDAECRVLSRAEFGEDVYASPAIADGRIYIRTTKTLYCFGLKD